MHVKGYSCKQNYKIPAGIPVFNLNPVKPKPDLTFKNPVLVLPDLELLFEIPVPVDKNRN